MNGCSDDYHGYWALDINATRDSEIYAAGAGRVTLAVGDEGGNCDFFVYPDESSCPQGSRGNRVVISHDPAGNVTTRYLHFTSVVVKTGDLVDQNTLLGTAGDSGLSGPGYVHLHFEERVRQANGAIRDVDPVPLKACHGDQLKSYPQEFGMASWSQVASNRRAVRSDGTACADEVGEPPAPTPGPARPLVVATTAPVALVARAPLVRTGSSTGRSVVVAGLVAGLGALLVTGSRRRARRGSGWVHPPP